MIIAIYSEQPGFPVSDQHPEARRYEIGGFVVDALGGAPTEAEVSAVMTPPPSAAVDPVTRLQARVDALTEALLKA